MISKIDITRNSVPMLICRHNIDDSHEGQLKIIVRINDGVRNNLTIDILTK